MIPLLIVAGLVVAVAIGLFASGRARAAWVAVALAALVGGGAVLFPVVQSAVPERPDATVSIVQPANGSEVPAGEPVTVEIDVQGAELAESETDEGEHLHLYVDGELHQMPYSNTTEVTLEPGSHTLMVELVDYRHAQYDPPIETTVEVSAA